MLKYIKMNISAFPTSIYTNYICDKTFTQNPLRINKTFTLYQYNNWISISPRFTWGEYIKNKNII